MNLLVTGGAGYIGSICVEQLLDAGHHVTVFDNLTEGHRLAVDPRATLIAGDLQQRCDIEEAMEKARPEAVMHFAANALVGESMTNPSKYPPGRAPRRGRTRRSRSVALARAGAGRRAWR